MLCPKCGTDNKPKFKFCVKCGNNLENPGEVNIEQVDMGGYRSEDDEKNSFKIGSGTFTISDRAPAAEHGMFTADELNDTDEEFDFSSYDEPYIPKLDADRLTVPSGGGQPQHFGQQNAAPGAVPPQGGFQQPVMPQNAAGQMMNGMMNQPQGMPQTAPQPGMYGAPVQPQQMGGQPMQQQAQPMNGQPMQGMAMNPYMNQMYAGQPVYGGQPMMSAPQIIGYDQNGMPIYGQPQPMMYAPPQIVGYDQNGMPIYGQPQPVMYAPPQIVGYDQNGMPIYGQPQPVMYSPQMMNENGEPQNSPYPGVQPGMPQMMGGMPAMNMNAMPGMPQTPQSGMYGAPVQPQQMGGQPMQQPQPMNGQPQNNAAAPQENGPVKVSNEFWDSFFSGNGNKDDEGDEGQDDFFSKPRHSSSSDMGSVSAAGMDLSRLQKHERKKNTYMNDTPEVNAEDLQPNKADELNKRYMRTTAVVDADNLEVKKQEKTQDKMGVTEDVSSEELEAYEYKKTRVTMKQTEQADAAELQVYEREHKEAIMEQADHAVEALPKKKTAPVDELDAIELPEYMQARKTVRSETPEIPGLPEI